MPNRIKIDGALDNNRIKLNEFIGIRGAYAKIPEWKLKAIADTTYARASEAAALNRLDYEAEYDQQSQPMVVAKGRTFKLGRIADADTWAYGRTAQTLTTAIETPAYIIESLIREEILTLRDLRVTGHSTSAPNALIVIDELTVTIDDYYNGSYIVSPKVGECWKVTDYVGSTKTLYVNSDAHIYKNDIVYLMNINASINTSSFDLSDNSTTGLRKDWILANSIINSNDSNTILETICYESMIYLLRNNQGYKIIVPSPQDISGTFQYPVSFGEKGNNISVSYTPLDEIYTDFTLHYNYCPARGTTLRKLTVNKRFSSHTDLDTYKTDCLNAENNYRLRRKWEYTAEWIKDEDTAVLFLEQVIKRLTKQFLIAYYIGTLEHTLKYEIGDQILLYLPSMLPDTISYSKVFMIFSKKININSSTVEFGLIEMAEQPTNINITTEVPEDLTTEDEDLFFIE